MFAFYLFALLFAMFMHRPCLVPIGDFAVGLLLPNPGRLAVSFVLLAQALAADVLLRELALPSMPITLGLAVGAGGHSQ